MIVRLAGVLIEKHPPFICVDVNGVGYELQLPMTSIYPLPLVGQPVILLTHLSVSENSQQLFGFYTKEERDLFRLLIKVNGIGPKMALAILSGISAAEFAHCVRTNNVQLLVKVPGVGKKTAERLLIEMRDRLPNEESVEQVPEPMTLTSSIVDDAESALIALGYKPAEAARMIQAANKQGLATTSEELIRASLQRVNSH